MISNIKFGNNTKSRFAQDTTFYVYHNLSESTLINSNQRSWFGIEVDVVAILSHEALHKVIFKLEGSKVSTALVSSGSVLHGNVLFCAVRSKQLAFLSQIPLPFSVKVCHSFPLEVSGSL